MPIDRPLLEAALVGFHKQKQDIEQSISDLERRLRAAGGRLASIDKPRKKHRISAEGRKRIAEAQRRRWANSPKKKAAA